MFIERTKFPSTWRKKTELRDNTAGGPDRGNASRGSAAFECSIRLNEEPKKWREHFCPRGAAGNAALLKRTRTTALYEWDMRSWLIKYWTIKAGEKLSSFDSHSSLSCAPPSGQIFMVNRPFVWIRHGLASVTSLILKRAIEKCKMPFSRRAFEFLRGEYWSFRALRKHYVPRSYIVLSTVRYSCRRKRFCFIV